MGVGQLGVVQMGVDQNPGVRRAKLVFAILSSFCDLVNVQSIVDLFAKQL